MSDTITPVTSSTALSYALTADEFQLPRTNAFMTQTAGSGRVIVVLCAAINWQIISNGVCWQSGSERPPMGEEGEAELLPISPRALGHISSQAGLHYPENTQLSNTRCYTAAPRQREKSLAVTGGRSVSEAVTSGRLSSVSHLTRLP